MHCLRSDKEAVIVKWTMIGTCNTGSNIILRSTKSNPCVKYRQYQKFAGEDAVIRKIIF